MNGKRAVLLDRDGTIIRERVYLSDPGAVDLIPGAAGALRKLRESGFALALITNQSGVGRGYFTMERVREVHRRLEDMLEAEGARLDRIYVCPHVPDDDCPCRKPRTALGEQAAREMGFLPSDAFVVGDKASDIEMGRRMGAKTVIVLTGYGAEQRLEASADYEAADLPAAADIIMRCCGTGPR